MAKNLKVSPVQLNEANSIIKGVTPHSICRRWGAYLMLLPALLFITIAATYPMLEVFRISLYKEPGQFVGLENFITALGDPIFRLTLKQTIIFVVISAIFHVGLGLLVALLLNEPMHPVFRIVMRSVIMLPWAVTPVVVGVIWRLLYNPYLSVIPATLSVFGLEVEWALLANPRWALMAVAVANIWFALPFYMLMVLASLQAIPTELYDAASIDGADVFQRFRFVTVPQLRNTLITLTIFDFIGAFVFFDLIWIMTGGGPVNSTEVLATYAYRLAFERFNFGYSAAVAVLMFLVMIVFSSALVLLMQRD